MPLDIRIQWNAGTACVLKTLACRGLHVGPSKSPKSGEPCENSRRRRSIAKDLVTSLAVMVYDYLSDLLSLTSL